MKHYPLYPMVEASHRQARDNTFRGNTFGQNGTYHHTTQEDRQIASTFDVAAAIAIAEKSRSQQIS